MGFWDSATKGLGGATGLGLDSLTGGALSSGGAAYLGGKSIYDSEKAFAEANRFKPYQRREYEALPEYQSLIDPNTGKLKDPYRLDYGDLESYNRFSGEALRDPGSLSKWGQLELQAKEQQAALDQAARQSASGAEMARGSLARQGGLSSGAAERLGTQAQRDLLRARQGVTRQGALSRIDTRSMDEKARQAQLGELLGYDTGAEKFNTGTRITDEQARQAALREDALRKQQFEAQQDLAEQVSNLSRPKGRSKWNKILDPGGFFGSAGLDTFS